MLKKTKGYLKKTTTDKGGFFASLNILIVAMFWWKGHLFGGIERPKWHEIYLSKGPYKDISPFAIFPFAF